MSNTIVELNSILFEQLRAVNDTAVDPKEREERRKDAKAVADLGRTIINGYAVQLDAIKTKAQLDERYCIENAVPLAITGEVEDDKAKRS